MINIKWYIPLAMELSALSRDKGFVIFRELYYLNFYGFGSFQKSSRVVSGLGLAVIRIMTYLKCGLTNKTKLLKILIKVMVE